MPELVVENVQKWLGDLHILKGASLTADRGSILALLGASGSGKTTLLRCIAGLVQPELGFIQIGDQVVQDHQKRIALPPERRNVGLVFQSYALWPHRSVRENVGYGLKLRGIGKSDMEARIRSILGKLGLAHLADRYPDQLSGGQQQRVAICRALVYEPRVLLLDEPLSNLDAKLREEARYFIRQLIHELGLCAILVTHDQSEALAVADNILLLEDGRIVQQGSPQEVYSKPNSFYSADFMGTNNVVAGRVQSIDRNRVVIGGEGWSLDGIVRDPAGVSPQTDARAVIRVEQISVSETASEGAVEMILEDSVYLGDKWEYRLRRGDFSAKAFGARRIGPGAVWAQIPPESIWVFGAKSGN